MAAYWRTNLTLRQLAPLFGVSKSAADRIVDRTGPLLALNQRQRLREGGPLGSGPLSHDRNHASQYVR